MYASMLYRLIWPEHFRSSRLQRDTPQFWHFPFSRSLTIRYNTSKPNNKELYERNNSGAQQ